ncbi:hypothetical protein TrVFT333_005975 [Trichoderma virens FT-333]|nr:hypothetical protein TrVFT333_005975 [Trichoderma virens FT-333]
MACLTYISLIALASSVLAAPQPALTGTEGTIASTVRIAGPTAAPNIHGLEIAAAPQFLTITVINSHGDAISTSHAHDPNGPSAVSGNVGPGTMANGATAAFAVPTGWIGNVAINDAGWAITGDDSLIEGNFVVPQGSNEAVADVDVSYVLNSCGNNDGQNACVNPLRSDEGATSAAPFFAPCQHAAWTYVNDGAANSFGQYSHKVLAIEA